MSQDLPTVDPATLLDGLDLDIPLAGPDTPANDTPHFFGPYQLIQQVGAGGVARVLRARHIHPRYAETTFAIKILHRELSVDPEVVALFRHEAYVLSLLKHPNIVQTFEAGSQDGELFIAMEYIDGRDLDNMLVRTQRAGSFVPLHVAMHVVGEVLKALAYAHELLDADGNPLNLVHRDVTPANVFLSYDGHVKLGDFGVASVAAGRRNKTRELVGKAGYFAPEQLTGDPVDQRADLFATGVVLFEMLTGTRLFGGDDTDGVLRANKRAKIPKPTSLNPAIPPALEAAMLTALERKPGDRFQDAAEMSQALAAFVPTPVGMPLAVAALMRKVFLAEHIQELQLREGLAGGGMARGSGQVVAVLTGDERAQAAFHELLLSRGYRSALCPATDHLAALLASGRVPDLILADVSTGNFSPAAFIGVVAKAPRPTPVVAVSEALAAQWIHYADAIGAVDLLFKPFNIDRVLTAVRAAVSGATRLARLDAPEALRPIGIRPRLLVVSRDVQLAVRLTKDLSERGFEVEVAPTAVEALERTEHASYHAVLYDAHPPAPADRVFASQFRSRPAMGVVPVVYLAAAAHQSLLVDMATDRSAVRRREEPAAALTETLQRLLADNRLGRIFLRYSVALPVELRYGGRVFQGQSIDLARGGVMLRCEQMPPLGTEVGVAIKLPGLAVPVEVTGRVLRVDLPNSTGDRRAGIGVEFERFAGRGEPALIAFLRSLETASPATRTAEIAAPLATRT